MPLLLLWCIDHQVHCGSFRTIIGRDQSHQLPVPHGQRMSDEIFQIISNIPCLLYQNRKDKHTFLILYTKIIYIKWLPSKIYLHCCKMFYLHKVNVCCLCKIVISMSFVFVFECASTFLKMKKLQKYVPSLIIVHTQINTSVILFIFFFVLELFWFLKLLSSSIQLCKFKYTYHSFSIVFGF